MGQIKMNYTSCIDKNDESSLLNSQEIFNVGMEKYKVLWGQHEKIFIRGDEHDGLYTSRVIVVTDNGGYNQVLKYNGNLPYEKPNNLALYSALNSAILRNAKSIEIVYYNFPELDRLINNSSECTGDEFATFDLIQRAGKLINLTYRPYVGDERDLIFEPYM